MKKLLMGLFLVTSLMAVADGPLDYVEDKLELKYSILTDSKRNSLNIEDVDVGIFNGKVYVNLEMETFSGDGGWGKFDKASYEQIAKQIADDVRGMINTNDTVEVTLILEKELGRDLMLHNGIY